MGYTDSEKTAQFDIGPEDITWRMRYSWLNDLDNGASPMIESVLPHFESEAIKRLETELTNLKHEAPQRRDGFDAWRAWWLNEALHNCDGHDPIGLAGGHLSVVGQAAVNILMVASELRDAIHYERSEKSAALGMLLISEALTGGYSIELSSLQHARKKAYQKGVGNQAKDFGTARSTSVNWAGQIWKKKPALRIGEVAKMILEKFKENPKLLPNLEAFPKPGTIKNWLKKAHAEGKLTMPEGAQAHGRAPKSEQ